jgi:hypothetical protein
MDHGPVLSVICLRTRYIFKENRLLVLTLTSKRLMGYSSIRDIRDTSALSAHTVLMVYSKDLVRIRYDEKGDIMISSARKQEFLSGLRTRRPLARS